MLIQPSRVPVTAHDQLPLTSSLQLKKQIMVAVLDSSFGILTKYSTKKQQKYL